ncbi:C4-dicarboxylate ABC transporter [Azorhizobium oxalatiphilum]|uniref:C4-dicarboxylate ABC transporter n=1 Tax=Azorhizobium oxalatiphilum TaxID=980631 RepID=A0A917C3H4_9HYPH|nr:TRAP transporter substrate-binding protein DctP [Azorhizobium oxalatiphilum]GGF68984.1 C4-dicarboxylate ABC transporter [Azorhizobium oxalatiphilum]
MLKAPSRLAAALLVACAGLGSARAADVTHLRVADSFPSGHYLSRLLLKPWMDEVTKRTNGAIVFDYFPGQQLGKAADMLALTQNGVADIGYVAPAYVSDKMPTSEVAMLPGSFANSCEGTRAYWKVARDGLVAKQDYAPNRIRLLIAVALPPYQILTAKTPVTKLEDLKGLKLRSTGGAQDLTLRTLGAVPVRMAAPDTYESLSRGTLDGVVFPLDSVVSYNVEKLVKHSTEKANFSSFIVAYSISDNAWKKLTPEVQKIMQEAGDATVKSACAAVDQQDAEIKKKLQDAGVAFEPLTPAFSAQLTDLLKNVANEWATGLDGRGKQGTAVLKEFREALGAPAN